MTLPLTPEEREEVAKIVYELETEVVTHATFAAELIRLRAFVAACRRDRRALAPRLQRLLREKCPERNQYDDWRALATATQPEPPR